MGTDFGYLHINYGYLHINYEHLLINYLHSLVSYGYLLINYGYLDVFQVVVMAETYRTYWTISGTRTKKMRV